MATVDNTALMTRQDAPVGFVTQQRHGGMAPAMVAEQQRARSEIEAALTIAAARPRDQRESMDRILVSCQRPGLAAKAKYRYAKGGTDIEGVTIDLMEVVAQQWGNLTFGFRELARFAGQGGAPGESAVEAFAWDLETNVKRQVQFTVLHAEKTRKGLRVITDPREIYEWVANQAQRRVRTCLENIIPRDIIEAAADQCDQTMRADVGDIKVAIGKLVPAFAQFGVTQEMIEARLQRRMETISPAQVVYLRQLWVGLRDGISHPEDWFDMTLGQKQDATNDKPKSAAEEAKEKMRQKQQAAAASKPAATEPPAEPPKAKPAPQPSPAVAPPAAVVPPAPAPIPESPAEPPPREREPGDDDEPFEEAAAEAFVDAPAPDDDATLALEVLCGDYADEAGQAETLTGLKELRKHADANPMLAANPDALSRVHQTITQAEDRIRSARGSRSSRGI